MIIFSLSTQINNILLRIELNKKKKKKNIQATMFYLNPTIHKVINDSNTNSNSSCPTNPVIPISPDRFTGRKKVYRIFLRPISHP